jgi:hypothetical protein
MNNLLKTWHKAKLCIESLKSDHHGGINDAVRAKRSEKADAAVGIQERRGEIAFGNF